MTAALSLSSLWFLFNSLLARMPYKSVSISRCIGGLSTAQEGEWRNVLYFHSINTLTTYRLYFILSSLFFPPLFSFCRRRWKHPFAERGLAFSLFLQGHCLVFLIWRKIYRKKWKDSIFTPLPSSLKQDCGIALVSVCCFCDQSSITWMVFTPCDQVSPPDTKLNSQILLVRVNSALSVFIKNTIPFTAQLWMCLLTVVIIFLLLSCLFF